MKCPQCGSDEIDYDPARGDSACVDCGHVLEQNVIVSEIGFQEDGRGRSNMIGQHVRADGRPGFSSLSGFSRRATEMSMQNGRRHLQHLASSLKLHNHHVDASLRLFRLAVERNFHKGRRTSNVCCACLYIVCRIEKTPHMLLDFSDVLQTNLYVLGHTFLKFSQLLSIELPIVDPSLYIHRFASKLELGDKTHTVAMSALRLLARMRRDWMGHGRRPAGLCGAALIVAARMHSFYRSQKDVVRVVRVGNMVLKERLRELDRTPTANLKAHEIDAGGGDDGKEASLFQQHTQEIPCDPPAFERSQQRKRAKERTEKQKQIELNEQAESEGGDDDEIQPAKKKCVEGENDPNAPSTNKNQSTAEEELEGEIRAALASDELQELERESQREAQLESRAIEREKRRKEAASTKDNDKAGDEPQRNGNDSDEEPAIKDVDLSDLDDEDAAQYLNTQEEYEEKKVIWTEINKDYLERQEQLETMRKERPDEYKRLRPWKGTGRSKGKGSSSRARSRTATTEIPSKPTPSRSKKLNYAVLENLGKNTANAADNIPEVANNNAVVEG